MGAITMPRLSDSMEEGTIVRWLVPDGAEIARGADLVEIETDKATQVHQSDAAGVLRILVGDGETVGVGQPIGTLGGEDEDQGAPPAPAAAAVEPPAAPDGRAKASPLARRLARDRGVDLSAIAGSGPGGRIVRADVEAAAPASASAATTATATGRGDVTHVAFTRLQQTVARRMAQSRATIPDFTLEAEADLTALLAARAALGELADPAPTLNDLVVKGVALALRRHPRLNAAYRDDGVDLFSRVNVGIAVATPQGLVVPTIFDADRKGLAALAADARDLAGRARAGTCTAAELDGGTFTVSNLGMYGVTGFAAIINPPQVAILTVGAVRPTPAMHDGALVERSIARLMLSCDHRALDGAQGAEFLQTFTRLLEAPAALAL